MDGDMKEIKRPIEEVLNYIKLNFKVENGVVFRNDGYIGSLNRDRYRQFKINYGEYKNRITVSAHHIAWFFYKGEWPKSELDHIDRDKENNNEDNLRESDKYFQALNRSAVENKKSGLPIGVKRKGLYYEGYATINGKKIYVGMSKNPEEIGRRVKAFMLERNAWYFED